MLLDAARLFVCIIKMLLRHCKDLSLMLDSKGYNTIGPVTIRGDGNCLFRAFAFPNQEHVAVRARLVEHVQNNWETYRDFIESTEQESYVSSMNDDGTWGDELMLCAFAQTFNEHVIVVSAEEDHRPIREYAQSNALRTRTLTYDGCHYNLLSLRRHI